MTAIPAGTLAKNLAVESHLAMAATFTDRAVSALLSRHTTRAAEHLGVALEQLTSAGRGASKLTPGTNLLDAAAHRWTTHAQRDAREAVALFNRGGRVTGDLRGSLMRALQQTHSSTTMAADSAGRSLTAPRVRALPGFSGAAAPEAARPVDVVMDGQIIDALGNPARGGRPYAGVDDAFDEFAGINHGGADGVGVPPEVFLG